MTSSGRAIIWTMNGQTKQEDLTTPRDEQWLEERLAHIWYHHFPDVAQLNDIAIVFGRKSRTRLGSIGMPGWKNNTSNLHYKGKRSFSDGTSVITITGYFMHNEVPDHVIEATIAHELVHYAHGFHSPHEQRYSHPHKGGIVDKELIARGLGELLKRQKSWLKENWHLIAAPSKPRKRRAYAKLSFLSAYRRKKA